MDYNYQGVLQSSYNTTIEFLPHLFGALVILLVGYIVAILLQWTVRNLLTTAKFDRLLEESPANAITSRLFDSPTGFVAKLTYWLVFFSGLSLAISALKIEVLDNIMGVIFAYLPHVVAAVIIFLVASAVSTAVVAMTNRVLGRTPLSRTVGVVIPAVIMSISVFMILNELMIAPEIVVVTYTAIIGAVALGLALAFGLGGRDVAARLLEQAYAAGKNRTAAIKNEAKAAKRDTKK